MPHANGCDAGYCAECGRYSRRTVGRRCYICYLQIAGLDRTERYYCDPGREERIARYTERANMTQPLFED